MACNQWRKGGLKGKCNSGFPVTTGCFATGELERNTINGVKCGDEEWCGRVYSSSGGSPPLTVSKEARP